MIHLLLKKALKDQGLSEPDGLSLLKGNGVISDLALTIDEIWEGDAARALLFLRSPF